MVALALVADHDADTRQMYAEHLRACHYEIEEAEDGRDALAKALSYQPELIVTETRLPGISGIDLCKLLRSDPLTRLIPIVAVTPDAFARDVIIAEQAGADVVLVKPCLPERLAAEVSRVLAKSQTLRARGTAARQAFAAQQAASNELIARSHGTRRRVMMSHVHDRHETRCPPVAPPALVCPVCDAALRYIKSHIGGVSERYHEQWDYFECTHGCGTFQHRPRTRRVRRVS
jgi:two-component system, cell cycle response regulator DivK